MNGSTKSFFVHDLQTRRQTIHQTNNYFNAAGVLIKNIKVALQLEKFNIFCIHNFYFLRPF